MHIVVIPLDLSQLPSQMWIPAFLGIQNFIILLTNCSDVFCHSLCAAGFVHFVDCEVLKLGKAILNSVSK